MRVFVLRATAYLLLAIAVVVLVITRSDHALAGLMTLVFMPNIVSATSAT
jgi:hypothetical protein